jgi:hypothetical protein
VAKTLLQKSKIEIRLFDRGKVRNDCDDSATMVGIGPQRPNRRAGVGPWPSNFKHDVDEEQKYKLEKDCDETFDIFVNVPPLFNSLISQILKILFPGIINTWCENSVESFALQSGLARLPVTGFATQQYRAPIHPDPKDSKWTAVLPIAYGQFIHSYGLSCIRNRSSYSGVGTPQRRS